MLCNGRIHKTSAFSYIIMHHPSSLQPCRPIVRRSSVGRHQRAGQPPQEQVEVVQAALLSGKRAPLQRADPTLEDWCLFGRDRRSHLVKARAGCPSESGTGAAFSTNARTSTIQLFNITSFRMGSITSEQQTFRVEQPVLLSWKLALFSRKMGGRARQRLNVELNARACLYFVIEG